MRLRESTPQGTGPTTETSKFVYVFRSEVMKVITTVGTLARDHH